MQSFPLMIRDWNDLDTYYERPDGGPSDARLAGERMLEFCQTHQTPYVIGGARQHQTEKREVTQSSDLFQWCAMQNILPPLVIRENSDVKQSRCVEIFEDGQAAPVE